MNRNTFFVLFLLISNLVSGQDLKLWYSQPAQNWSEALPIGNSRLGAMVYGGIEREELQLNEETFWAGSPYNNNNPNAVHVLPVVRKLIFEGRNKEAQRLIDANFLTQQHGMSYLTLGSLYLEFPEHQNASGFYRDLNLENATATTRYQVDDVTYTRTTFASFTDDVIIMHIKASKANALNFTIAYNCPLVHKVNVQNDQLTVTCQGKEQEGLKAALRAECQIQVKTNGTLRPAGNTLQINEGTEATLYISAATNYVNYQDVSADESRRTSEYLKRAMQIPYEKALKSHIAYYKKQFDRVRLTLPTDKTSQLETPKRIENFGNGEDMAMAALLFHYGRYLLISSSQPGGQPANLQGIWNNSTHAPWDSKYTININTEMNYWPAEVTNLSETHSPLFSMLKKPMQKIRTCLQRTPNALLCALGAVVFLAGFYFLCYRTPLKEVWLPTTMNNDEALYNRQVVSVLTHGGPQGYFGYQESTADIGRYGTWGPLLIWAYALPGLLFGASVNVVLWCNLLLIAVGIAVFARCARLNYWQCIALCGALFSIMLPLRSCVSGASEAMHYMLALLIVGTAAALHRSGKTGWLIACAAACAVETIFRPYALLFWVFPLTAVWQNKRRRAACLGTAAGGFTVSLFAMAKLAAPYFSDGGMDFDGIRQIGRASCRERV